MKKIDIMIQEVATELEKLELQMYKKDEMLAKYNANKIKRRIKTRYRNKM